MLSSFLLSLREGLEAALVIGIVLGALRQLHRPDCARVVWSAVASAVIVSIAAAVLLHLLGWSLRGSAEPVFEGVTLFVAAGLLTWMIAWMNSQARQLRGRLEADVQQAVCAPGARGVFVLTFIAVAREGTELAIFLTAAGIDSSGTQTLAGAGLGLAAAALLGWLLFATTARLNLARFFQLTSALLIFFAAGLVAKGVHEFNEIGWIPALIDPAWNTRHVLNEHTAVGSAARTLFGYTSTPSLTVVVGYSLYLSAAIAGTWVKRQVRKTSNRDPKP
jgi:high-affinity iron transporter